MKKKFVAPDKIISDEEIKIEKKIQKHLQKSENSNEENIEDKNDEQ